MPDYLTHVPLAEFGTQQELQLLVLLVSAAALLLLADPLRIPYPILLVLGGLVLGFTPGLPDLTLPCLGHGPAVHLSGLTGTPTVVNIWGSWCGPCQAETRYLSSVYDAAKGKVRFLGVDTEDDPKSALDFAPHVSPPMHYPQVVDKDKKLLIGLNLPSAVPTTVFVDASGRVVHIAHAPYRNATSLRTDIQRYLGVTV